MNGEQAFTWIVLAGGVIALAVQTGIAIGWRRHAERVERQRSREVKLLLEWVGQVWRQQ